MADSDDDYDRKRRDKFRGERNEYRDMGGRRPLPNDDMRPRRDDWNSGGGMGGDRGNGGDWANRRGGPQRSIDYRLGGGHRVQHEFSPPNKRPRVEWDRYSHDSSGFGSGYGSGFDNPPPSQHMSGYNHPPPHQQPSHPHKDNPDGHPHMLSFKAWLSTQDDGISDQDALSKYADYKKEFKRQQLNEFFVAHREEEWFRNKYHPDDSTKRKEEQFQNLRTRVTTFVEFMDSGRFQGVTLDATQSEKIIKLMDWYVIRLEGGSNDDAAKLLSEEAIMKPRPALLPKPDEKVKQESESKKVEVSKNSKENGDDTDGSLSGSESEDDKNSEDEGRIRKRKKEKKVNASAVEALEAALETNNSVKSDDERDDVNNEDDASNDAAKRAEKKVSRRADSDKGSDLSDIDDDIDKDKKSDDDDEMDDEDEEGNKKKKDKKSKSNIISSVSTGSVSKEPKRDAVEEEEELPQLHRTSSIFLRNLSPSITKQEVEALCKKYPGFLRVAIADPQADRRWNRRGWVTFKRNVNIKEICWNLNNIRLRDTELGPIVNRDLSRRVRTINGITPHKTIVRNDIRLAAKVIQHLDSKWNLWDEDLQQEVKQESYGVYSTNPVLKNITDYLIEEASAEEEELLGLSNSDGELDNDRDEKNNSIERDDELIQVLDRLLFYLRFVHSLDYYNHAEYPYEDEMPNRLGIVHARGMPPATKVNVMELQEYNRNFESKISTFVQPNITLTDNECKDFGMKDQDAEVEKFIVVNTKELGKDKWLCPLSGKKFKGPEFVRKHILNKHGEKLEEVKKEVVFFNNYLRDPKRPASPEPQRGDRGQQPQNMMQQRREPPMQERDFHPPAMYPPYGGGYNSGYGGGGGMYGGPPSRPPPQQGYAPYRQDFAPRGRPGFRTGGRDYGNRSIISYRDLDAPNEQDDF